jgi:hypothetical protein
VEGESPHWLLTLQTVKLKEKSGNCGKKTLRLTALHISTDSYSYLYRTTKGRFAT